MVILTAVIIASVSFLSSSQKKARDAKRRGDLKAVQNNFEQYYMENFVYPEVCTSGETVVLGQQSFRIPFDPHNLGDYQYQGSCSPTGYCLCAKLETGKGGNSQDINCTFASNGGYFCVENLQ